MLRILIVSKNGSALGVGQRLGLEGHHVDFWCPDERTRLAGRGLVTRVTSPLPAARLSDLICLDTVGLPADLQSSLLDLGRPILGCSPILDKIELDRRLGMHLFQTAGLTIPPTWAFSSTREAARIVKEEPWQTGWVIKPNGNVSTAKTMIVKDQTQWDRCLSLISPDSSGILQRVLTGIEVSTEGWFSGKTFMKPFNHTFEEKKLFAGGLGPNTGCMGNVVLRADADLLVRDTVLRLQPFLAEIDYHGPIDLNCIVTPDAAYVLEATSRFGYDAIEALAEGLDQPLGDLLWDCATGGTSMSLTDQTMIAVRLSVPPWPHRKPDRDDEPCQIEGVDDDTLPHLFLTDAYKNATGYWTAGADGIILKATARGVARHSDDPSRLTDLTYEARRRVYRLLDRIHLADKQYRTDIGERVNSEVAQLREWGWLDA